ncbi:MAG: peptidyl-prolyl cis-trans isomerase [Epsilonproteobacteria bacterium]|nr:MAG: peptidyl-prolyl cis-trans isomerase [Campylobacterota bacterium]
MYKIFLILSLSVLLNAEVYDGVAIVVKDRAITLYEIKKEMATSKVDVKKASDILIRKRLEEIETQERKITVSSSEIYDDIKKTAARNNLNISEFYEAVRESSGLSSTELKEKVKHKLLSQKLYSAIAYSSISQPSEEDVLEYYEMHKDNYKHPSSFTVIIYQAKEKSRIQEKIDNPMFYSPDIATNEQVLPYDRISPELASLLERTALNSFTAVIPDGKKGYMSFYIKEIESAKEGGVESVKNQIINSIMAEQREQVLGDYFARLRLNADINIIRMPK